MRKQNFRQWLKAAMIRAIKTFAQALISVLGAGQIGIFDADWKAAFSVALMAAVISILTSLAGLPEVDSVEFLDGDEIKEAD